MDKGVAMAWGGRVCVTPNGDSFFFSFYILKLDVGDDRMTINIPKILIIHSKWIDFVACK